MYRITKISNTRILQHKDGSNKSMSITLDLIAPTKRGDGWSHYLADLHLHKNGKISFSITHLSSSAWGNCAWRLAPYDYSRPDVHNFVMRECSSKLLDWKQILAA